MRFLLHLCLATSLAVPSVSFTSSSNQHRWIHASGEHQSFHPRRPSNPSNPSSTSIIQHTNDNDSTVIASPASSSSSTEGKNRIYDPADAFNNNVPASMPSSPPSSLAALELQALEEFVSGVPDLDGNPLSTQYLATHMGLDRVESYSCPQDSIFRGFMSNGCRLHLQPGGETVFYKCVVFDHLHHAHEKLKTAPFKLCRDAQSYQVVAAFLSSKALEAVTKATTGIRIPKCYVSDLRPNAEHPIHTKCSFLMEDLSPDKGWYQQWLLQDPIQIRTVLSKLAQIHAFFWHGSDFYKDDQDAAQELELAVWESGSYVQPKAQNANQCQVVAQEWKKKRMKFQNDLQHLDCWDDLGDRLQAVAVECGRLAHPFADDKLSVDDHYRQYRTFTHGDPKQANFLFRRCNHHHHDQRENGEVTKDEKEEEEEVGIIDFQWAGFGLAATDIAHFLTSAVHANALVDEQEGEAALLKHYHDELQTYLVQFGACKNADAALEHFPFETFLEQYEIGVLDVCRLVIAYTWARFDQPVDPNDKVGCDRTMNKTSYNKSIPNVVWLVSRCDELLKKKETEVAKRKPLN